MWEDALIPIDCTHDSMQYTMREAKTTAVPFSIKQAM